MKFSSSFLAALCTIEAFSTSESGAGMAGPWASRYMELNMEQKKCEDLAIGEETLQPGEAYQSNTNAKLMADNLLRRDVPGKALRSFHPKSHGCLSGTFKVSDDLAEDLQLGPFQPGAEYPVWSNWATATPFHPEDDTAELGKSVGIKMFNTPGKKLLPGQEDSDEFHFLMNNGQSFWCNDLQCFFGLVNSYMQGDVAGSGLPKFIENFPAAWEHLGKENVEGKVGHVFDLKYWGQTPFTYGEDKAFKYFIQPCEENPQEEHVADSSQWGPDSFSVPVEGDEPNILRQRLRETMANTDGVCFSLWFQFQQDTCKQLIEDSRLVWDLKEAEPVLVGQFTFGQQEMPEDPKSDPHCANAGFQSWLVNEEFRPLGSLNRGRKLAYSATIAARQGFNNYADLPKGSFPCCMDGLDPEKGRDFPCGGPCEDKGQSPSVAWDSDNNQDIPVPKPEL